VQLKRLTRRAACAQGAGGGVQEDTGERSPLIFVGERQTDQNPNPKPRTRSSRRNSRRSRRKKRSPFRACRVSSSTRSPPRSSPVIQKVDGYLSLYFSHSESRGALLFATAKRRLRSHTLDYTPFIKIQLASTRLTFGPNVVQIWSRNISEYGGDKTLVVQGVDRPVWGHPQLTNRRGFWY